MGSALGPWKFRVGLISGHVLPWILHLFFNSDKINDDDFSQTVTAPKIYPTYHLVNIPWHILTSMQGSVKSSTSIF